MLGAFVAYRSDQSRTSFSRQRKYGKEVGLLEIDMELTVNRRAGGLNIRDIEKVTIGAARISHAHCLAHDRVHAIAPGNVGCLADLFPAVSSAQTRDDAAAFFRRARCKLAPIEFSFVISAKELDPSRT